ncbi:MAG TPA: hypothetical protein PKB13_03310 [Clostridia bacterium]|nr:hypothetical protein [Clostridia bacterium]
MNTETGKAMLFYNILRVGIQASAQNTQTTKPISRLFTAAASFQKNGYPIGRFMLNSLILAGGSSIIRIITASLAAFAFPFFNFRGKTYWFCHRSRVLPWRSSYVRGDADSDADSDAGFDRYQDRLGKKTFTFHIYVVAYDKPSIGKASANFSQ